jgi:hypothetical protein
MTAYAVRADVYKYGLPRGVLANPGRLCASAVASTNAFELDLHGFETDDDILFRAEAGGTLPAPIVAAQTYKAIRVSETLFKAAATAGGSAIDLTTDGEAVVVATPLPFDDVLEFYSRFADAFLPAHLVPLTPPYPVTVVALVSELSAKKLLLLSGQSSVNLGEAELAAKAQLERWASGIPLRDSHATSGASIAYSEAAPAVGPRNWTPQGGTLP